MITASPVDMTLSKKEIAAWAESRAQDIRAHSGNAAEASRMMLLLADDRRAEAENLTEKAETDLIRAKKAREGGHAQAADELEVYARSLDDQAKELVSKATVLEELAMKPN